MIPFFSVMYSKPTAKSVRWGTRVTGRIVKGELCKVKFKKRMASPPPISLQNAKKLSIKLSADASPLQKIALQLGVLTRYASVLTNYLLHL